MGIVNKGILGPIQNKVGTVIGRNFRGLNVITKLYNKSQKPVTSGQQLEQDRLTMLSSFLSKISSIIDLGFKKTVKRGQSTLNAAYSFNYKNAFIEENGCISLNFPKIVLSRGLVERPNCASVQRKGAKITFTWLRQAENKYSRYDDYATFVIYCVEKKRMIVLKHKVKRSDLQFEYELAETLRDNTLHCYIIFSSQNGKLVGTSEYIRL